MYFFSLAEIRAKARQSLKDIPGIFTMAIIPVILSVLVNLLAQFRSTPSAYEINAMSPGELMSFFGWTIPFPLLLGLFLAFLSLSIIFSLVRLVRRAQDKASYRDSFAIFTHPKLSSIIATYLLRTVILTALSIVIIIGFYILLVGIVFFFVSLLYEWDSYIAVGLIAMFLGFAITVGGCFLYLPFYYKYSLMDVVLYDQLETETYTGPQAVLRESARLMKGYKQQAFYLDLSFIGWYILNAITLGIAGIYTIPYTGLAHVYFYQAVLDDRQKKQMI